MGLLVSTGLHIQENQHTRSGEKLSFRLSPITFPFIQVNQDLLTQQDEEEQEEISSPLDRSLSIFPLLNDSLISSAVEIVAQQRLAERLENLLSNNSPLNDLDSSLFSGTDSENQEYFFHNTASPLPDVSFRPASVVEAENRQLNNRDRLANHHVNIHFAERTDSFDSLKELFSFLLSSNQIRLDSRELICSRTLNTMYLQTADSLDESSSDMDFESSEIHHSLMRLHALQSASLSGIRHMLPIGKVPQCQSFNVSSWPLLQQTFKNVLYDIQMRTYACYCDECTVLGLKRTSSTNAFSNESTHSSACPYSGVIIRPDLSDEELVLPGRILGPQMLAKLRSARAPFRTHHLTRHRDNCCPYLGGLFDGNRAVPPEGGSGRKRITARAAFRAAEERKSQLFNWHMAKAEYAAIHEPHLVDLLRARECGTTLGNFRRRRCGRILRSGTTRLDMETIHAGRFTTGSGDDKAETKMKPLPGSAELLSHLSTEKKRCRNKCAVTEAIKDVFGRFSFHCNCTSMDDAVSNSIVPSSTSTSSLSCEIAVAAITANVKISVSTKLVKHDSGVLLTGSADLLWRDAHRSRPSAFTAGQCTMIGNRFLPNQRRVIDSIKAKTFCISYLDNGDGVLTASQDQQIRIYKARGRRQRYLLERNIQVPLIGWSILDVVVSPDGRYLVYSTWNEAMYQYDLHNPNDNWQQLRVDPREERFALFSLRFNADGSEIVAGSSDQHVYIYNREVGRCVLAAQAHEDDVNTVCFGDAASHIILSGGDDGLVKVWDRRTMGDFSDARPVGQFAGHRDGITYIDSRGDDRYLISNSKDQTVKMWDLRHFATETAVNVTKRAVGSQKWDYRWQCSPLENLMEDNLEGDCSLVTIRGHSVLHTLIRARFSPEHTGKRYIYTGCGRGNCVVYDFLTGETARVYTGHASVVRDCAWHPTRNEIVTSSWDGKTHLWRYDQREAANGARVVDGDRLFDAKCYGVGLGGSDDTKTCEEDDEDEPSCDESYRDQPLYRRAAADGWQRRLRKRFVRRAAASNTISSSSSDDEILVENTSDDDEEAAANQGAQSGGLEVDPVSVARRPTPINSYAAAAKRGKQRHVGRS